MGQGQGQGQGQGLGQGQGFGDWLGGRTGAGGATGTGYLGGYGYVPRSAYATPADLDLKPWTAEFTTENGDPAYPLECWLNPYLDPAAPLEWRVEDWDPALRFWDLPFDSTLTEWLQDLDLSAASVQAAREFAGQHGRWAYTGLDRDALAGQLVAAGWLDEASDLQWRLLGDQSNAAAAWQAIRLELGTLGDHMQDTRARYLNEAWAQADGIPGYFLHVLGIDRDSKPWTMQLIRCGLAIGNLAYMHYKSRFRRPRPSFLAPGLVPPFGPPRHPAFPSGHSFLGHFIALLLLEIDGVAQRFGVGMDMNGNVGVQTSFADISGNDPLGGVLFWLAERLGVSRERIGVHYPSDTRAGRHLAGGIWNALFNDNNAATRLVVPTLHLVLNRARAEWVRSP